MADNGNNSGGLLGIDPSLLASLGIGLLSSGAKNSPMRGNVGLGLASGVQNYYGQRAANQQYQMGALQLQRQQGMFGLADTLVKQASQTPEIVAAGHILGGLMGDPAPQSAGASGAAASPQAGAMAPPAAPSGAPMPMPPPGGQPQGAAPPPVSLPAQSTQTPSWLTAPTAGDINRTPIGGMDPRLLRAYAAYNLQDPLATEKATNERQLQIQQEQYAPIIGRLETLAKVESPTKAVSANDDLQQAWTALAPKYGLDPKADFNDNKVRQVFAAHANTLRSALSEPLGEVPVQMQTTRLPDGRIAQTDPVSGKMNINTAGPDVLTARERFQNAIDTQRLEMEQTRNGVPSGYARDNPNDPQSGVHFIPGGPADPMAAGGGLGQRNEVMFQRVVSSAQAATRAMRNIAELPITTSTGILGAYQAPPSLLGAVKGVLAQKVTGQEAQDYKTMLAGISRNLSTVETAGLSPNGSLTHSMDSLTLNEGDTQMTKLRKMAEMRQILEENLGPQLANPKLPPSQQELVRGIIQSAREAVPFTQSDITALQRSKNPKQTIMDFASSQGLPTGTAAPNSNAASSNTTPSAPSATPSNPPPPNVPTVNAKGWQLHQDAKGNYAYVSPDGKNFQALR